MPQRTPLHDWHAAHGGRMVPFAGWDMPVQYTTIIDEHNAVRSGAGLFDVSHMGRLSFAGTDALALIQRVYTNNAATLKEGQVRYGLVLNEAGGVRDDVLVYRWTRGYGMVVNASNREKILAVLKAEPAGRDLEVIDETEATAMIAVQGPRSLELVRGLTEVDPATLGYYFSALTRCQGHDAIVSRTGYTGEDGVELTVGAAHAVALWEELVRRGGKPCGLGARDTLRLEAGMPLYGHELTEEVDPLQAGLGWAVKFDKGDFLGRSALLQRREDNARRLRVGLDLEGRRMAREGTPLHAGGQAVGVVTSGTFAPTLNRAVAMAYVAPAFTAPGTILTADVRGTDVPAKVVPLPFYKRAR